MVLCKFFLQGNCRFGENCKFEHQYADNRQPHASIIRQQSFNPNPNNLTAGAVDTSALVRSVTNDMNSVEKGKQWPLSCYAPFKEKSLFPGFEDHSFEEIRYGYYTAKKNGTVEAYCQQLNALLQESAMRVLLLQNPTQEAIAVMRNIYDEPGQSTASFANSTSTFGGNTQMNVFGNSTTNATNIFGQANNVGNTNIFNKINQPPNPTPQSIFATANQTLFSGQQQPAFGNNNQSIFGNTPQISNRFGQSVLVENPVFQQPKSTFGNEQAFKPGGFANTPFSTNTNTLPFGATPQNNSSFLTPQSQLGATIFSAQPSGNSPLVAQQPNASFNIQPSQNTPFTNSNITQQLNTQAASSLPQGGNIFNSNINTGNFNAHPVSTIDESIYSKPEDLSESDIKSYAADAFEFGKVPEKPPHISMC